MDKAVELPKPKKRKTDLQRSWLPKRERERLVVKKMEYRTFIEI